MKSELENLYNTYKKPIYQYLYKVTLNPHIAEELCQDTFLRACSYFSLFRKESSAKTWLFKISRSILLNYIRKKDCKINPYDNLEVLADTKDKFQSRSEQQFIHSILLKLKEEERSILILRDINGFKYTEIAKIMNFTENQVKIKLHRVRKKFRNLYNIENNDI